jgi:fucokinase
MFHPSERARQRWRSSWRLSLNDILVQADLHREVQRRQALFHKISRETIVRLLVDRQANESYLILLKQTIADGYAREMLDAFDRTCLANHGRLQVLSCLFSAIANALAEMAGGDRVGLRSGPYLNRDWQHALVMFEGAHFLEGIQHLIKQRQLWMDRPDLLIRAARHYDGRHND